MNAGSVRYSIADEVFSQFPDYLRGVVVVDDVTNGDSPDELVKELRAAESSLRGSLTGAPVEDPRISSWREAYRAVGVKPTKFRPSMEAMARRALKNDELPAISSLVDIGNIVSLRRLIPAGGHATDVLAGDIALRAATGEEEFTPFGSDRTENPLPGEIIFVEGNTVLTRRWTWRQAQHSLMTPDSKAIEFNVDGLPPVSVGEIEDACGEIAELIERFCGGVSRIEILSRANPEMRIR